MHSFSVRLIAIVLLGPLACWAEQEIAPSYQAFLDGQRNLPDFSHAGRNGRAEEIPAVTRETHQYFDVTSFGAIANDGRSDRTAIIETIAAAEAHGRPAAVWFPAGSFIVRDVGDALTGTIEISRDHVVLKGSGMYSGGTTLRVLAPSNKVTFSFACPVVVTGGWRGKKQATATSAPRRGDYAIEVDSVRTLKAGDYVSILGFLPKTNNDKLQALFAPHEPSQFYLADMAKRPWIRKIKERHRIESISGTTVTFGEPVQFDFTLTEDIISLTTDQKDRQHYLFNVGIEDMAIVSNYSEVYAHYKNILAGGYNFIRFGHTVNAWARRLRLRNYTNAIHPTGGMYNTFHDILLEGNVGHMSISGYDSYGNLYAYIREFTDSHHGLGGAENHVNGVFLRCVQAGNLEAHCKHPHATLFDVNEGNFSRLRPGGAKYTPMHGTDLVYWNWNHAPSFFGQGYTMLDINQSSTVDFWREGHEYGYFLPPSIIGLHGNDIVIKDEKTDVKINESQGAMVKPVSLFEAQLADRLKRLPEWLAERSRTFEEISRNSRVQITFPRNDQIIEPGSPITIRLAYHGKLDLANVTTTELYESPTFDFDHSTARRIGNGKESITYTPDGTGPRFLYAVLVNILGEEMVSDPVVVYLSGSDIRMLKPQTAYLGSKLTDSRSVQIYKRALKNNDMESYRAALKMEEAASTYAAYEKKINRETIKALLDGKEMQYFSHQNPFSYHKSKDERGFFPTLIFDFGGKRNIVGLRFNLDGKTKTANLSFEIQASNDPDAYLSAYNNDNRWHTLRRVGRTLLSQNIQIDSNQLTFYITPTKARYFRIWVRDADIKVSEISFIGH